jgi:hypothetical protein
MKTFEPTRRDVLLVVKCPPFYADAKVARLLAAQWPGKSVLVAPDRLASFGRRAAFAAWCAEGGRVATFDPQWETDWLGTAATVHHLKFGYDPVAHWHPIGSPNELTRGKNVVFVGAWDPKREELIRQLCRVAPIDVWGSNWKRASPMRNVRIQSTVNVYGERAADAISSGILALNLVRPQNARTSNMRTYEIPAQGGYALAVPVTGTAEVIGLSAGTMSKAEAEIERWLGTPPARRESERLASRESVRPFTYAHRLHQLLAAL